MTQLCVTQWETEKRLKEFKALPFIKQKLLKPETEKYKSQSGRLRTLIPLFLEEEPQESAFGAILRVKGSKLPK